MKPRQSSAAALLAVGCAVALSGLPNAALGDWSLGADAQVRHDDNVGNARDADDVIGDSLIAARLSAARLMPIGAGYSLSVAADLSGENYRRLDGLNNATLGGTLALRKKWGLGAFAPWVRIGLGVARTDYRDDYRNARIDRATLALGRRIDERRNLWSEYAFERRSAATAPAELAGVSGDAFSQTGHTLSAGMEFAWREHSMLTLGFLLRHGDVVSTTLGTGRTYQAPRAYADDTAFGPNAYAYRIGGTTFGLRLGINYSPTPHSLIGLDFLRIDTHAAGGGYAKSVPEITWKYRL